MSDPIRWKDADDAPEMVREALRRGGAVPPLPAEVRAAVGAEIARAGAANAPPKPDPAMAAAGKTLAPIAVWGPIVALLGAVVAAIVVGSQRTGSSSSVPTSTPASAAASQSASNVTSLVDSAPPPPEPNSGAVEQASPATSSSATPALSSRTPRAGTAQASPPRGDTLAEESALIARARSTLASDPAMTLGALVEHAQRYPRGELAPERDYLRVSALRRLHRVDEAKTRGRAYLATYPSSPYAPAVRDILSELGERL